MKMESKIPQLSMIILMSAIISTICLASLNGTIEGTVKDQTTGEEIPFANIILSGGGLKAPVSSTSNISGAFIFKEIKPGNYSIEISAAGYVKKFEKEVKVIAGKTTRIDLKLTTMALNLKDTSKPEPGINLQEVEIRTNRIVGISNSTTSKRTMSTHAFVMKHEEHNTEQYDYIPENEFHKTTKNPLSTFSIDVDGAAYANVRRFINEGKLPPVDAVRVEEMINYFKYDYPEPTGEDPFSINMEIASCPWNNTHQLISVGLQAKKIEMKQLPVANLVFLVDVSGSMMPPNKLPLLIKSLSMLTNNLRKEDRIAIVVYAGNAGVVLPSTSGEDKTNILRALESLEAGGSTAGGEGILLAYKIAKENFIPNGNNRVILATDGDFNIGVSSDGELVRLIEEKRDQGIFLTVLGFGTGNLKDSKMEKLANKGNGNYAYIDNILEAKKVLVNEMGGTLYTIAKDVKLQLEFNPEFVKAYKLIGYENRMLQDKDFNDDKKDAGELGSGHTVTALYEIIPSGSKETLSSIDPLKYQKSTINNPGSNEILTAKFRYKEPNGTSSKLIIRELKNKPGKFENASNNLKFASAVASFGLLLRKSEFKGNANYDSVLAIARSSKGIDHEGYRAEFIRLVEMAALLK